MPPFGFRDAFLVCQTLERNRYTSSRKLGKIDKIEQIIEKFAIYTLMQIYL